jgi:hypothetical protein
MYLSENKYARMWNNIHNSGESNVENLGLDGRLILKLFLKKLDFRMWRGFACHRGLL